MTWVDALGWASSLLLVVSLMQARMLRFRVLNFVASLALVAFNAILAVWPNVALNLAGAAINAYHLVRLTRARHDDRAFDVVEVGADDAYLHYLLRHHEPDIQRHNPGFRWDPALSAGGPGWAYLVVRDADTAAVVLLRGLGDGAARVELDYVLPRFRDFTPGEFVYGRSGPLAARGVTRIVADDRRVDGPAYFRRLGFRPDGDRLVREPA